MTALMRRLAPGGFAWLVLHELRVALRARARGRGTLVAILILVAYLGVGLMAGVALRHVAITPNAMALTGALVGAIVVGSFMTTQAMLASQRTLFDGGDLDLLLSAPVAPRRVMLAKLTAIAGSIVLTFAALVLPMALPVALLSHPGLLGIPALLVAVALLAACLGLAITLGVVKLAGPRAARTVGQIVAAVLAGAIFLVSQLISQHPGTRRSGSMELFRWFSAHHVGTSGPAALPGRAAFGDPGAIALVLGGALLVFAVAGRALDRGFLRSYQAGGVRLSPRAGRASSRAVARQFRAGLFASMFGKEWRLLARDPALAFQIVLRLVYLAPLVLVAFNHANGPPVAPTLAFISVVAAGQVVGSLAWIVISAEDAPDLLAVAPITRGQAERAKLVTALVMAAPIALILPVAIAFTTPTGALATLAFTAIGGALAGLIELKWQKPMKRSAFLRRRSGSLVSGLLTFLVTGVFGLGAGAVVWLLG
jgi:ABC-2 type transport system permease protein